MTSGHKALLQRGQQGLRFTGACCDAAHQGVGPTTPDTEVP